MALKKTEKATLAVCETLGGEAFKKGILCVPALDPALKPQLKGLGIGKPAIRVLKAWIAGWTKANLAAPVEGN